MSTRPGRIRAGSSLKREGSESSREQQCHWHPPKWFLRTSWSSREAEGDGVSPPGLSTSLRTCQCGWWSWILCELRWKPHRPGRWAGHWRWAGLDPGTLLGLEEGIEEAWVITALLQISTPLCSLLTVPPTYPCLQWTLIANPGILHLLSGFLLYSTVPHLEIPPLPAVPWTPPHLLSAARSRLRKAASTSSKSTRLCCGATLSRWLSRSSERLESVRLSRQMLCCSSPARAVLWRGDR